MKRSNLSGRPSDMIFGKPVVSKDPEGTKFEFYLKPDEGDATHPYETAVLSRDGETLLHPHSITYSPAVRCHSVETAIPQPPSFAPSNSPNRK